MTEHCPLPHLYKVTDMVLVTYTHKISGNRPSRYGLPKKDPSNYFFEHNGAKCLKLKLFMKVNALSKEKKLGAYIFSCIHDS